MNVIQHRWEEETKLRKMVRFLSSCVAYISSFCRLKVERELPLCAHYRPTLTKENTSAKGSNGHLSARFFGHSIEQTMLYRLVCISCGFSYDFRVFIHWCQEDDGAATVAGRCHATYSR